MGANAKIGRGRFWVYVFRPGKSEADDSTRLSAMPSRTRRTYTSRHCSCSVWHRH